MRYRNSSYSSGVFASYWFTKNMQGDIVGVYSSTGVKLISYSYDAWGNVTATYSNGGADTAAVYNPFKYRGYYHDSETGFYYLNSRYYDPVTCRFINADRLVSTGQGLLGYNMFAYCNNNPVNYIDSNGNSATAVIIALLALGFGTWALTGCGDSSDESASTEEGYPVNNPAEYCEQYATKDDAAIGASIYMNELYQQDLYEEGRSYEYSAFIFTFKDDDNYYFSKFLTYNTGSATSVKYLPNMIPDGATIVAHVHSHPWQDDDGYAFSFPDYRAAKLDPNVTYYVAEFHNSTNKLYSVCVCNIYADYDDCSEAIWPK